MNCFICCKVLPKEETFENDNEENLSDFTCLNTTISDNDHKNQSKINGEANILLICHYLKLPRNKINEAKELGTFLTVRFCEECDKLSEKLGELCGLLEITQMKVNYYLNLLTDKIIQKEEEQVDQQNVSHSSFQETFHKKCLAKLAAVDPNPKLLLRKSKIRRLELEYDKQFVDRTAEVNEDPNVTLVEFNEASRIPQQHSKYVKQGAKYYCDFCPLTFNNLGLKRCHIEGTHVRKRVFGGPFIKPCEHCGAMLSSATLKRHKSIVHGVGEPLTKKFVRCGCGNIVRDKNIKRHQRSCGHTNVIGCTKLVKLNDNQDNSTNYTRFSKQSAKNCSDKFECSNCKLRFIRRADAQYHIQHNCKTGKLIDLEKQGKAISIPSDGKMTKWQWRSNLKTSKCEYCNVIVYTRNLKRHINNVHLKMSNFKRVNPPKVREITRKNCEYCELKISNSAHWRAHMLEVHKVEITDKGYRCNECNTLYTVRTSWRRHLSNREKCRLAANVEQIAGGNENERVQTETKEEESSVLVIGNEHVRYIKEDPLSI